MSTALPLLIALVQFAALLACLDAGFRYGVRLHRKGPAPTLDIVDTAVFALLGLLLGFAFSGAMSRLDARRDMIVQEANAIGTAYMRVDLLATDS